MRRKSFRIGALLLLPLALGALIGGVKWKQLHPTPTPFDLQERAFLRKAKCVKAYVEGKTVILSSDEFKATLDDFYLIDLGDDWKSWPARSNRSTASDIIIRVGDDLDNEWSPFAEIHLGRTVSYGAGHVERPNAPERRG